MGICSSEPRHEVPQDDASLFDQKYEFQRKKILGKGGYGFVAVAVTRTSPHREVAVKIMQNRKETIRAWEQEVSCISVLDHPNIVKMYDSFKTSDRLYIVLDYLKGGDMFDRITTEEGNVLHFTEKYVSSLVRQMLSAVSHCHSKHIVHRDIKPENFVFVDESLMSEFKLIDFGVAATFDANKSGGQNRGTTAYMAPEVLSDGPIADLRPSDIWSIGVILYILLCGQHPFLGGESQSEMDTEERIRRGVVNFPPYARMSQSARELIGQMMDPDPHQRLTAEQALQHPWVRGQAASEQPLDPTVVTYLREFAGQSKLKKAVASVMAGQVVPKLQQQLEKTFRKMADSNGRLAISRLKDFMLQNGVRPDQADAILADADANNDGSLDFQEFSVAVMSHNISGNRDQIREAFDYFDADGNGFVDIKELVAVVPHQRRAEIEAMFKEADSNNDGLISYEEWESIMLYNKPLDVAQREQIKSTRTDPNHPRMQHTLSPTHGHEEKTPH